MPRLFLTGLLLFLLSGCGGGGDANSTNTAIPDEELPGSSTPPSIEEPQIRLSLKIGAKLYSSGMVTYLGQVTNQSPNMICEVSGSIISRDNHGNIIDPWDGTSSTALFSTHSKNVCLQQGDIAAFKRDINLFKVDPASAQSGTAPISLPTSISVTINGSPPESTVMPQVLPEELAAFGPPWNRFESGIQVITNSDGEINFVGSIQNQNTRKVIGSPSITFVALSEHMVIDIGSLMLVAPSGTGSCPYSSSVFPQLGSSCLPPAMFGDFSVILNHAGVGTVLMTGQYNLVDLSASVGLGTETTLSFKEAPSPSAMTDYYFRVYYGSVVELE